MSKKEVRTPERHFDDLDDIFTGRLRERGATQTTTVPFTGPPSTIGFIVFVFTSEEDTDEDLLDGTLDGNDGDNSENGMGGIPKFQEPLRRKSGRRARG